MKNYGKNDAREYCANWNSGECLGCMMRTDGYVLKIRVDSKLAGKDCIINQGCDYFDMVVVPSIPK